MGSLLCLSRWLRYGNAAVAGVLRLLFVDDDDWFADDPLLSAEQPSASRLSATLGPTGQEQECPRILVVVGEGRFRK